MSQLTPENIKQQRDELWRADLRNKFKSKDRTDILRVVMPSQDPDVRNKNHVEVNIGLSNDMALAEARRCLDCVNPTCILGCPVNINIPKFIKHIEAGQFNKAIEVIKDANAFPAICGRVCPQEIQCEANCFYTLKLKKPAIAISSSAKKILILLR